MSRLEPSPISAFTLENYEKNCHTLECILLLEGSKQSLDDDKKHELLLNAIDEFNLLYEDKIWMEDLEDGDLEGVLDERLVKILEKGVFVK